MSESKFDDESRWWLKERIKRWLHVRHFSAAVVGGARHKEYAMYHGLPSTAVFTGYDVVDNHHFTSAADAVRSDPAKVRQNMPAIPRRPYFITVTRLVKRKNVDGLISAYWRYLQETNLMQWDLVVCGNGPEMQSLVGQVRDAGLEARVHFPGFLPYDVLPAWYSLAGAFVHPAHQEQWGLVVNEACAVGLPVIVGQQVGARYDLVEPGQNGFLIDSVAEFDIARKLTMMAELDHATRTRMAARSRELVGALAPDKFGDAVIRAVAVAKGRNG